MISHLILRTAQKVEKVMISLIFMIGRDLNKTKGSRSDIQEWMEIRPQELLGTGERATKEKDKRPRSTK
jgi:hypothetical protein